MTHLAAALSVLASHPLVQNSRQKENQDRRQDHKPRKAFQNACKIVRNISDTLSMFHVWYRHIALLHEEDVRFGLSRVRKRDAVDFPLDRSIMAIFARAFHSGHLPVNQLAFGQE